MNLIKPQKLKKGDTIGIIAPCSALPEKAKDTFMKIEETDFRVKLSKNLFSATNDYVATIDERIEDINEMLEDENVKAILFGGGFNSNELLPYIDYEKVRSNPKIWCSFSGGTTLINTIYSQAGLSAFCGASARLLSEKLPYTVKTFEDAVMNTSSAAFSHNSEWSCVCAGNAQGVLIGGNLQIFSWLLNGKYFNIDKSQKYILFIEEFSASADLRFVGRCFHHIIQSILMDNISGILFGSYDLEQDSEIEKILKREFGRFGFPIIKCDDFGHRENCGTIPIGINARLDTDNLTLEFLESRVY